MEFSSMTAPIKCARISRLFSVLGGPTVVIQTVVVLLMILLLAVGLNRLTLKQVIHMLVDTMSITIELIGMIACAFFVTHRRSMSMLTAHFKSARTI